MTSPVSYKVSTKDGQTLRRNIDQLHEQLLTGTKGSQRPEPAINPPSLQSSSPSAGVGVEVDPPGACEPEQQPDSDLLPQLEAVAAPVPQMAPAGAAADVDPGVVTAGEPREPLELEPPQMELRRSQWEQGLPAYLKGFIR